MLSIAVHSSIGGSNYALYVGGFRGRESGDNTLVLLRADDFYFLFAFALSIHSCETVSCRLLEGVLQSETT